jgi:hypothetical protein
MRGGEESLREAVAYSACNLLGAHIQWFKSAVNLPIGGN